MRNPKNKGRKLRGRDDVVDRGVDAPASTNIPDLTNLPPIEFSMGNIDLGSDVSDIDFIQSQGSQVNPFNKSEEQILQDVQLKNDGAIHQANMNRQSIGALPSLPSMSNAGASAFTGVVNWNAVSGGFQPLPQTVGKNKLLYQLSQFHGGINKSSSPRDIADFEAQSASNVIVSEVGRIKTLGDLKNLKATGTITAVAKSGTVVTYTTSTDPHGLSVGDHVYIAGTTNFDSPGQVTTSIVQSVPSTTTFTLSRTASAADETSLSASYHSSYSNLITQDLTANAGVNAGFGFYVFKSSSDLSGTEILGGNDTSVVQDTYYTHLTETKNSTYVHWLTSNPTHAAPIFYASGGGIFVCDSNFDNTDNSAFNGGKPEHTKAFFAINREDADGTITGYATGAALIHSPVRSAASTQGTVRLIDASSSDTVASATGETTINVCPVPSSSGTWNGTYYFYMSYTFDTGSETGLTALGSDSFSNQTLRLNPSTKHTNNGHMGKLTSSSVISDKRITGARIYFREDGEVERFLLAELSLKDGVRGALDTNYIPWTIASNVHDLADADRIVFDDPPKIYTYASINGYDANEVYTSTGFDSGFTDATCDYQNSVTNIDMDSTAKIKPYMMVDGTGIPDGAYVASITNATRFVISSAPTGLGSTVTDGTLTFYNTPTAIPLRYKTAVVGQNGVVFIANIKFDEEIFLDGMMFSMPGKPGIFPKYNFFDSPSSDGSPIVALAAFQDTILQFKENAMYVINISNPAQFYAEASFRDCGVSNPCQVFTTAFGVIFANKFGCFIYDGQKVMSLSSGKLKLSDWGLSESSSIGNDGANVPCVGYDPRSQNIIVLKDIGHDSENTGAWIFNMVTQSWTEATSFIDNDSGDVFSNFQISANGYLSIMHYDASTPTEVPFTFNLGEEASQSITYITKDLDFGIPTQTKKIFKIYVTYLGDGSGITVTYGANGDTTPTEAMTNAENSGATLTNAGTTDHNVATFTLNSHPSDLKSIMLKFTGTAAKDFEINDISILYRARPIK